MIYIENIYMCMAAPLLVAYFCSDKVHRHALLFLLIGMSTCLLSAYINTFIAQLYGVSVLTATLEIAPVVEELLKLLPVLFYLIIFEPKKQNANAAILIVAVGFATFENICYLVEHGADNLPYLLIRGFGTGAMHIVCGAIIGYGLLMTWQKVWLQILVCFGMVCIAMTFHAEYNLWMHAGGAGQLLGAAMPISFIALWQVFQRKKKKI